MGGFHRTGLQRSSDPGVESQGSCSGFRESPVDFRSRPVEFRSRPVEFRDRFGGFRQLLEAKRTKEAAGSVFQDLLSVVAQTEDKNKDVNRLL